MSNEDKKDELNPEDSQVRYLHFHGQGKYTFPTDGETPLQTTLEIKENGKLRISLESESVQKWIDKRYKELREEYGYGGSKKAFDELKKQLEEEGRDPEKYGLKNDPDAFRRAYNKRKNKRLREQ
jgi:uncharacterized protein YecE (DUF72 family)